MSKATKTNGATLPGNKIGPNLSVERNGSLLSIHMDLEAPRQPSTSGKTEHIAVVRGWGQVIGATDDGKPITLAMQCRVPASQ